jgi:hypothetical protein
MMKTLAMIQSACCETFSTSPTDSKGEEERRASRAQEREGNALRGQQAHDDAQVDEGLDDDRERQARGEEGGERVGGLPRRPHPPPQEHDEGEHDRAGADEAQLLPHHREDEIAVGVRQVEQLLPALREADAGDAAGADGDEALDDLVAAPARVGVRVEEGLDPVPAIRGGHDRLIEQRQAEHGEHREVAQPHPADDQHHHADDQEHERAPEVRLDEDQVREPPEQEEGREEGGQELVHALPLLLQVIGEEEHRGELGQLRGLEREAPEADPPVVAVHGGHEEHHDQEHGREPDRGVHRRRLAQLAVVEPHRRPHHDQAQRRPHDLLDEEVVGAAVRFLGQRGRCAPHHDQAHGEQGQRHREQRRIRRQLLRHYPRASRSLRSRRRTSSLNARPRAA